MPWPLKCLRGALKGLRRPLKRWVDALAAQRLAGRSKACGLPAKLPLRRSEVGTSIFSVLCSTGDVGLAAYSCVAAAVVGLATRFPIGI